MDGALQLLQRAIPCLASASDGAFITIGMLVDCEAKNSRLHLVMSAVQPGVLFGRVRTLAVVYYVEMASRAKFLNALEKLEWEPHKRGRLG